MPSILPFIFRGQSGMQDTGPFGGGGGYGDPTSGGDVSGITQLLSMFSGGEMGTGLPPAKTDIPGPRRKKKRPGFIGETPISPLHPSPSEPSNDGGMDPVDEWMGQLMGRPNGGGFGGNRLTRY